MRNCINDHDQDEEYSAQQVREALNCGTQHLFSLLCNYKNSSELRKVVEFCDEALVDDLLSSFPISLDASIELIFN